jgi:hypothetical protein
MGYSGDYAIIDVTERSPSKGKILVLLDNEQVAEEIAADLRRRGRDVVVQIVGADPQPTLEVAEEERSVAPLVLPTS